MPRKLADYKQNEVLNYLNERLTFEREGVKLYDRILEKMKASGDANMMRMYGQFKANRDQEKEHEEWLEAQIRDLGGDAHATTELSSLAEDESSGINRVIMSDTKLPHLFHALLAAELVDHAGWDLLVSIADEAGDEDARRGFMKRLQEEEEHLLYMREVMETLSFNKVLGEPMSMPDAP